MAAGEPDFATPVAIADAGICAIRSGKTRYTAAAGLSELRSLVAESLERELGIGYRPEEICITASTKPGIFLALQCLIEAGDRVVVLAPYWVSYPEMLRIAGASPTILECKEANGFLPTRQALEEALSPVAVKGILLNSPCNPSGAVWPKAALEMLLDVCEQHDCWIISDEIYSLITYVSSRHISPASLRRGKERCIVANGLSKSFAMTGWRIGYLAGPVELIEAVIKVQSQTLGNPPTISQYAALEAYTQRGSKYPMAMLDAFRKRRSYMIDALGAIPGMSLHPPQGSFYLFPGVAKILAEREMDDVQLARTLLEEARVAVVPGSAFGAPGHIRLSFAASLEDLAEGTRRIAKWFGTPNVELS